MFIKRLNCANERGKSHRSHVRSAVSNGLPDVSGNTRTAQREINMAMQSLKQGEKILLMVFGVFFILAVIGYVVLETVRVSSDKPMYVQTTYFDFSEEGKAGSGLYLKYNCNACHRAVRSGTSMGLSLDGIGSKRSIEWLEAFLGNPESTYGGPTLDHALPPIDGSKPKEAVYVSKLPAEERRLLAVFLSELRADAGSAVAKVPPPERSKFVDSMVGAWAPAEWKEKYKDLREQSAAEDAEVQGENGQQH